MVRNVIIFVLAIGAVTGGYFMGRNNWNIGGGSAVSSFKCPKPGAAVAGDDVERKCVPFEGKARGSSKAQVTIVEFSDFQCPFCSRVVPTVDKMLKEYPDKIRIVFKQLPLPFHNNAPLAAEAALAAKEQGKFWEMHDKLFANQQALDRRDLEKYAQEIGLNMDKFKADLDSPAHQEGVDDELAEGKKIGAHGTPTFFINGKPFVARSRYEQFKGRGSTSWPKATS